MTNEAKRNEDTIESLVRHFLDSQLVSSICWDFPEQSGWPDVKRVLEQGFRAGVAAERERGARLSAEPPKEETMSEPKADGGAAVPCISLLDAAKAVFIEGWLTGRASDLEGLTDAETVAAANNDWQYSDAKRLASNSEAHASVTKETIA